MSEGTTRQTTVHIYAAGLVHCSVCVPKDFPISEIEANVNAANPTGLSHGWKVDDAPTFADGAGNPHPCEQFAATRMHYLMVC